jgi:ATPase subunit of ABC transporter with duplicated ATPase domains
MPAPVQPLLIADQVGFTFADGRVLFHELSLALGPGRTALVGANGIGKSTLLHILVGQVAPTSGHVLRRGRLAFLPQGPRESGDPGLVRQDSRSPLPSGSPLLCGSPQPSGSPPLPGVQRPGGFPSPQGILPTRPAPEAHGRIPTLADLLGITPVVEALARIEAGSVAPSDFDQVEGRWDVRERAHAALTRFGLGHLPLDRSAKSLSGGETTRVSLCGVLLGAPDLVVLDEPTNHLDAAGRSALYHWVEEWGGGLLVVSHDRTLLDRMDRIVELSGLGLRIYGGNFRAYQEQRAVEMAAAEGELEHATKELRKTARLVRRQQERQERRTARAHRGRFDANLPKILLGTRKESGESTARRLGETAERQMARHRERLEAARAQVEIREGLELELAPTGLHATRRILDVEGLSYTPPGAAAPLFEGVTFSVRGPQRWAICGPNGSGKSTLLRLLVGELEPGEGRVERGIGMESVAWLDQRGTLLDATASVMECFRAANPEMEPSACHHALARYLFTGDRAHARVHTLSGGERIRAALACTVGGARPPLLLILDEPTNHLDLDSLAEVEEVLQGYDGALVVVSHDATFLEAIGVEQRVELGGRRHPP